MRSVSSDVRQVSLSTRNVGVGKSVQQPHIKLPYLARQKNERPQKLESNPLRRTPANVSLILLLQGGRIFGGLIVVLINTTKIKIKNTILSKQSVLIFACGP